MIFFLPLYFIAQNSRQDLIICHVDADGQQFRQVLYTYHFVNGVYTGREELLRFDGKKDGHDYVRTDRGKNIIYKNRYIITGIGNIIDVLDKKVLFDGKAHLVRVSNDSAIYYTNDAFKGKFYSVYNFKTASYAEVTDLLFKALPDKDIEFDKSTKPFVLNYYPQSKPKVVLSTDAGYGQQNITGSKYVPDPPKFWVDKDHFIYAHFNEQGTEVAIRKIKIESGKMQEIGTVKMSSGTSEAFFTSVNKETLALHCGSSIALINMAKNTVTLSTTSVPENNYSYALESNQKGRVIYANGKEIGAFQFDIENFRSTENMLATIKMLVVGNETYQQGLKVWENGTKTWKSLDTEEIAAIVGWIEVK